MPLDPRRVEAVFLEAAACHDLVEVAILDRGRLAEPAFAGAMRRSRRPATSPAAPPLTPSARLSRG
jgi:hypothetical protein